LVKYFFVSFFINRESGNISPKSGNYQEHKRGNFALHYKTKFSMSIFNLLVTLIIVGVLLWLVNTYVPMDGKIKNILNIIVVIFVVLWLLRAFGLLDSIQNMRI